MDCHATATALARNDKNNSADCHEKSSDFSRNDSFLDSSQLLLRAAGEAIHNSAPAESINQSRTFEKVRNLESVQGDWGFKGDKGERFASSPPVPLEKDLSQVTPESSESEKKVESTFAKLDSSVDCHEVVPTSRNDKNNVISKSLDSSEQVDSKETSPSGERYPLFSKEATLCRALPSDNARNDSVLDSSTNAPTPSSRAKETSLKPLICIPTYNESTNIAPLLREIFQALPQVHILVIDDNSTDGTQEILAELESTMPHLHILNRPGKLGLASAYIDGFALGLEMGFSHFIQMDADFSHHPRYLRQTLANLSYFDVIINSRNIIGGGVVGWGLWRKILSRFGSLYARLWLGARVMDFTGGFNAYSAHALRTIDLHSIKSSGYCFQIEMKYRAYKAGLRLLELPIIFEDRIAGKSKMSKTIVLEALWRTPFLRLASKASSAFVSSAISCASTATKARK